MTAIRYQRGRIRGPTWLVLLALVALGVGGWAWWRYAPDSLPDFIRHQLPASPVANPPLYRWRDAQGRVHVTDRPPEDDRPYETLRYHPDTNVVPSLDGRPRD
jgi:hypothetical protein